MKLCVITCYNQPDYVRAKTLRAAAAAIDGVEVIVVKNQRRGLLRYPEVIAKLVRARIRHTPDAYLLTFRGYEMLLPVRILTLGKPLMYDEFINPIEWAVYEHGKLGRRSPLTWLFKRLYKLLLLPVDLILTDTTSHAKLSQDMLRLQVSKFLTIPVGTDESTFGASKPEDSEANEFTVLYYGNMLPLHGLRYVIEAAVNMNKESVRFVLVGGSAKTAHDVAHAVGNGANIEYKAWVDFDKLPALMRGADLCLAGPFGDTFQARYVITGKAYQYLAMGRPTVIGTNKESGAFRDKHDALIVKQADAEALADAIRWAMRNRTKLRNIGLNGQQLFASQYSNEQLATVLKSGLVGLDLLEPTPTAK
jgi:glycosyltransferase involved in cell wall biosynthesis